MKGPLIGIHGYIGSVRETLPPPCLDHIKAGARHRVRNHESVEIEDVPAAMQADDDLRLSDNLVEIRGGQPLCDAAAGFARERAVEIKMMQFTRIPPHFGIERGTIKYRYTDQCSTQRCWIDFSEEAQERKGAFILVAVRRSIHDNDRSLFGTAEHNDRDSHAAARRHPRNGEPPGGSGPWLHPEVSYLKQRWHV